MPMYEVEHVVPLNDSQRDELAEFITRTHTELFVAPRLFVNVRFTDISQHFTYVAGKRWVRVVGEATPEQDLHAIFVLGAIVAGREAGFSVPSAGEDMEWMKANAKAFQQKGDAGNKDMQELVEEIKTRKDFEGVM
ncbi:MAG: hypothetical protein M1828_004613 [Chrysothrix sp. TS-e1954]|nr:MAG: hypothetical protein M1828_004613 [Chrysothrix sp. TS-e1954]